MEFLEKVHSEEAQQLLLERMRRFAEGNPSLTVTETSSTYIVVTCVGTELELDVKPHQPMRVFLKASDAKMFQAGTFKFLMYLKYLHDVVS